MIFYLVSDSIDYYELYRLYYGENYYCLFILRNFYISLLLYPSVTFSIFKFRFKGCLTCFYYIMLFIFIIGFNFDWRFFAPRISYVWLWTVDFDLLGVYLFYDLFLKMREFGFVWWNEVFYITLLYNFELYIIKFIFAFCMLPKLFFYIVSIELFRTPKLLLFVYLINYFLFCELSRSLT